MLAPLLIFILLPHCAPSEKILTYTSPHWPTPVKADLYRSKTPGPYPAVILIHTSGLKHQKDLRRYMHGTARKLASRGYLVLNVTYRTPPEDTFPAPLEDIQAAIDWLENNASRENIDTTRIATFGYSLGGHLALLTGFQDSRIKAIVAGAAPSDLMLFEGGKLVEQALGGTRAEVPEKFIQTSPINHVTTSSPPTFLYHGTEDKLVPAAHSLIMKQALDTANIPSELHFLPEKGHVTTFLSRGKTETLAIDFLDHHLNTR